MENYARLMFTQAVQDLQEQEGNGATLHDIWPIICYCILCMFHAIQLRIGRG